MLKALIDQLASDLKLDPLKAADDGSYVLYFEPNISVSFRENPERGYTLSAQLSELSGSQIEETLLTLLNANLFGRETGGAMLGLDKLGKMIILKDFLPEEIDYKSFHDKVEVFVNYADSWKEDIAKQMKG